MSLSAQECLLNGDDLDLFVEKLSSPYLQIYTPILLIKVQSILKYFI